jgi:hypothetical protein
MVMRLLRNAELPEWHRRRVIAIAIQGQNSAAAFRRD